MHNKSAARPSRLAGALAVAVMLPVAAWAQQETPVVPPAGEAPAGTAAAPADGAAAPGEAEALRDPHVLMEQLHGGSDGSPTAQRGNPQPGTSTSIPTTNPATIQPLPQRADGDETIAVEDTGIAGQCDPVVGAGCPTIPREELEAVESELGQELDADASVEVPAPAPAAPADSPAAPGGAAN